MHKLMHQSLHNCIHVFDMYTCNDNESVTNLSYDEKLL